MKRWLSAVKKRREKQVGRISNRSERRLRFRKSLVHPFEPLEGRLMLAADAEHSLCNAHESLDSGIRTQSMGNSRSIGRGQAGISSDGLSLHEFAGQVFYLDFDGATGVTYRGPVLVSGIDVPAFVAPDELAGNEPAIIADVTAALNQEFIGRGVRFTNERPADGPYSTVFVGGDDSAFAAYGSFLGLAEKVDAGNRDGLDNALVFSERLSEYAPHTRESFIAALTGVITHEVGHLIGHVHAGHIFAHPSSLAEVAWEVAPKEAAAHQWMTVQAYRLYQDKFGASELSSFFDYAGLPLPSADPNRYERGNFNDLTTFERTYEKRNNTGFIEGVYDQDVVLLPYIATLVVPDPNPEAMGEVAQNPFDDEIPLGRHFWDFDGLTYQREFDDGLFNFDAAPNRAVKFFTGGYGLTSESDSDWGTAAGNPSALLGMGIEALYETQDYTSGPISYTPSSREVVLTNAGETWPEWAGFGHLVLGEKYYTVNQRKDPQTLVLDEFTPLEQSSYSSARLTGKARAYYWLGQVVHFIQDTTVPSHSLNDSHVGLVFDDYDPLHRWVDGTSGMVDGKIAPFEDASEFTQRYRQWRYDPTRGIGRFDPVTGVALGFRYFSSDTRLRSADDLMTELNTLKDEGYSPELRRLEGQLLSRGVLPAQETASPTTHNELRASLDPSADPEIEPLYLLALENAGLADDFDTMQVVGQFDAGARQGDRTFGAFTPTKLNQMADVLVPQAIKTTAEVIRYFYSKVDTAAPSVQLDVSRGSGGGQMQIFATASDATSGNTGVGQFKLEYRSRTSDGEWLEWKELKVQPGDLMRSGATAIITRRFQGLASREYQFRLQGEDGAGNIATAEATAVPAGDVEQTVTLLLDFTPQTPERSGESSYPQQSAQPLDFADIFDIGWWNSAASPYFQRTINPRVNGLVQEVSWSDNAEVNEALITRVLDYDRDGALTEADADLAMEAVRKEVEKKFRTAASAVSPVTDVIVATTEAPDGNAPQGWDFIEAGAANNKLDNYVLFVGAHEPTATGANSHFGAANQAAIGENNEWYGYSYAALHARSLWERAYELHKMGYSSYFGTYSFTRLLADTIAHEFGHMLGLGHVPYFDPASEEPKALRDEYGRLLNDRNSVMSEDRSLEQKLRGAFPNRTYAFVEQRDPQTGGFVYLPQNGYGELLASFTGTGQVTVANSTGGSGIVHDSPVAPAFTPEKPGREVLPSLLGILANTTPADIAQQLTTGFNAFVQNHLTTLASRLDLPSDTLPLVTSQLATLLNVGPMLQNAVGQIDVSSAPTMADLRAALVGGGFTVDSMVTDAELATLPQDRPADLLRLSRTYTLYDLLKSTSLESTGLGAVQLLQQLGLSADLLVRGNIGLHLSFGVDTGGFYVLSGKVLEAPVDVTGTASATIGAVGSASGLVNVRFNPELSLVSDNADGRIRLDDFNAGTDLFNLNFAGRAALNLDFRVNTGLTSPLAVSGQWAWDIAAPEPALEGGEPTETPPHTLDESESGLDDGSLLDSFAGFLIPAFDSLRARSDDLFEPLGSIPFAGGHLSAALGGSAGESMADSNGFQSSGQHELKSRGMVIRSMITPDQLMNYALNGTPLPDELISVGFVNEKTNSLSLSVSGSASLAGISLDLAANVNVAPQWSVNLTLGLDPTGGAYVAEGSAVQAEVSFVSQLAGSATLGSAAKLDASATGRFDASATLTFDNLNGVANEKLYLSDLADLGSATRTVLAGDVYLDNVFISGQLPALGAFSPRIVLSGAMHQNLGTGAVDFQFNEQTLRDELLEQIGDAVHQLGSQAKGLANVASKIPFAGGVISNNLLRPIGQALAFDAGGQSVAQYMAQRGFSIVSAISPFDVIDGSYLNKPLVEVRWDPAA